MERRIETAAVVFTFIHRYNWTMLYTLDIIIQELTLYIPYTFTIIHNPGIKITYLSIDKTGTFCIHEV